MIEAINRICARPAREQRPANYRMRTTGDRGQSKSADATKTLKRPATPRPHAHWHVDVATGRLECQWCLEDDISGESFCQQFVITFHNNGNLRKRY